MLLGCAPVSCQWSSAFACFTGSRRAKQPPSRPEAARCQDVHFSSTSIIPASNAQVPKPRGLRGPSALKQVKESLVYQNRSFTVASHQYMKVSSVQESHDACLWCESVLAFHLRLLGTVRGDSLEAVHIAQNDMATGYDVSFRS